MSNSSSKTKHMLAHIGVVLSFVVKGKALGGPLAFIIAAAFPIAVYITPICFCLRVLQRIAIDLSHKRQYK